MEIPEARWYAGLDVHKDSIAVAVLERYAGEPEVQVVKPHRAAVIGELLNRYRDDGELVACYEAGPTGYGLARSLAEAGIRCCVLAPNRVLRAAGERVKTDRRDAVKLARTLRSGQGAVVRIPEPAEEVAREYVRMRHEFKRRGARLKNGLQSLLLRHGCRYEGKTAWTQEHWRWIVATAKERPQLQECIVRRADTIKYFDEQIRQMDARIREYAQEPLFREPVRRMKCLKGIATFTALALAAEVGDFHRFPSAGAFMAFLGLVPSEHSSGRTRRTGAITKTGNSFLRLLLVEAAWHYARPDCLSEKLLRKRKGASGEVLAYAARASARLQRVYARLSLRRRNNKVAVVAVARELAGFVWGLMTDSTL